MLAFDRCALPVLGALLFTVTLIAAPPSSPPAAAPAAKEEPKEENAPPIAVTHHSMKVNGTTLDYAAARAICSSPMRPANRRRMSSLSRM